MCFRGDVSRKRQISQTNRLHRRESDAFAGTRPGGGSSFRTCISVWGSSGTTLFLPASPGRTLQIGIFFKGFCCSVFALFAVPICAFEGMCPGKGRFLRPTASIAAKAMPSRGRAPEEAALSELVFPFGVLREPPFFYPLLLVEHFFNGPK